MGIKIVKKIEYICDIGRLDCWSVRDDDYYNSEEEAKKDGWTEKDGKIRCPMCTRREDSLKP